MAGVCVVCSCGAMTCGRGLKRVVDRFWCSWQIKQSAIELEPSSDVPESLGLLATVSVEAF
jgi:hypothetical protein